MARNGPGQLKTDLALISNARALVPAMTERARECERLRRIPDQTVEDFHRAGLFRAIQPGRIGGSEVQFPVYFKICAEIARGCASSAWVLTNLASHHWMLTYWPVEAQDELWGESADVLIASGLAFPCGKASRVAGGYKLTGKWPFSSGVDVSTWNMLGGIVTADDDGKPVQRLFLVPSENYQIIDDWEASGLKGSGSKSVACEDVFVPAHRTVALQDIVDGEAPGLAANPGSLFRLPFFAMFPYVVGMVALGAAKGALENYTTWNKNRVSHYTGAKLSALAPIQMRLSEASASAEAAERMFLHRCKEVTSMAEVGKEMGLEERAEYRRDGAFATKLCVRAVDILFEGSGGNALYSDNDMQRHFRDVHAAAGHFALSWDVSAAIYGQIRLGLPFKGNL